MKWSRTSGLVQKRRWQLPARGQKGIVLVELLVSIAIFGVISVGFLSAFVAGYHGVIVAHEQRTAHTLTRTTLENVRQAPYPITDNQTTESRFRVSIHADYVSENYTVVTESQGLQMVTVTVSYADTGKPVRVTEELKVKS